MSNSALDLDLTPRPAAAPLRQRITKHGVIEASLMARNGEQLLLALVIPIAILVGSRFAAGNFGLSIDETAPRVLALALWSTCFTSVAISTGFERRYNVLERLSATPLGPTGLLAGKALAIILVAGGQLIVLALTAALLGWRPTPTIASLIVGIVPLILGSTAFTAAALALAGTLRAELTLALANLIYLLGLFAGGILWPASAYPSWWQPILEFLPTAALAESVRAAWQGSVVVMPIAILAIWVVLLVALVRKVFQWVD